MLNKNCPGSMGLKQPQPEEIACTGCGKAIEIWSDEMRTRCRSCGTVTSRDLPPSCVEWCPAALQCVGPEIYAKVMGRRPSLNNKVA